MGQSNRTTKRRAVLLILHINRIATSSSSTPIYAKHHWLSKFSYSTILNPTPAKHLIQRSSMISMHNGIYSKDTFIRPPPVTTKGTRRGPYCRLHSPGSCALKARGIRHDTNHNTIKSPNQLYRLPLHTTIPVGHNYNKLHLSSPNRLKIPNRILLCQSHSTSHCSRPYPDAMKLYRSNGPNNCPRLNIIRTILLSQFKLRANS